MDVHTKMGTLAEKLEFANALRKQAERELSQERIEHGKTKAYVHELEDRLLGMDGNPLSTIAAEVRLRVGKDKEVRKLRENIESKKKIIQVQTQRICQLEKQLSARTKA